MSFTKINNKILNDPNVSFRAKGLYAFIKSKPKNWAFSISRIAKQTKENETSIRKAIQELEKAGYLKRKPKRDNLGKFKGYIYVINNAESIENKGVYPFVENPTTAKPANGKTRQLENPSSENPSSENPSSENLHALSNIIYSNKDNSNKDNSNNNTNKGNTYIQREDKKEKKKTIPFEELKNKIKEIWNYYSENKIEKLNDKLAIEIYKKMLKHKKEEVEEAKRLFEEKGESFKSYYEDKLNKDIFEYFRDICSIIANTPFLSGEKTEWSATLKWLFKGDNLKKVANKEYE